MYCNSSTVCTVVVLELQYIATLLLYSSTYLYCTIQYLVLCTVLEQIAKYIQYDYRTVCVYVE